MARYVRLALIGIALLVMSGCGEDAYDGAMPPAASPPAAQPPPPPPAMPPAASPPAAQPPPPSPYAENTEYALPGLTQYAERCAQLNQQVPNAKIVYDRVVQARVNQGTAVRAAVTLNTGAPPAVILSPRPSAPELGFDDEVRVFCVIQASLGGATDDMDITPEGWQEQTFLTDPTARWSWVIIPKVRGNSDLVLKVQPVVKTDTPGVGPETLVAATIEEYTIEVAARGGSSDEVKGWLDGVTSILTSAKGAVVALMALVGAVFALRHVLGRRQGASTGEQHEESATIDADVRHT